MKDRRKNEEKRFLSTNSDISSAERYTISSAVAHVLKHNCGVHQPMVLVEETSYALSYQTYMSPLPRVVGHSSYAVVF